MRFELARTRREGWPARTVPLFPLLGLVAIAAACSGSDFSSSGGQAGHGGAAGGGNGLAGSGSAGVGALQGGQSGGGVGGSAAGSGPEAGRGTAGSSGRAATGGAAGSSPGGTGGSSSGGAGTGGMGAAGEAGMGTAGAGDPCGCAPAEYCRAGKCSACADFSQLDFAPPEEFLAYPSGDLRFPRQSDVDGSLFFTLVTSTVSELWYAPVVASSPGASLANPDMLPRAGLDYFGDPGSLGFDVLFTETASSGARLLRAATWQAGALGAAVDAPSPLGASGFDDYSVALARTTERAYWMTTRDGPPTLRTGVLGTDAADVVDLAVPALGGGATCPRQGDDAAPWVTPAGSLLLFSALPLDQSCMPADGTASDLYVVPLSSTSGLPLATAVPLTGLNTSSDALTETDASLSADLCTLYFASDGGGAQGHQFRLYRAARR